MSRGFARAYGVTPKRFRLEARVRRAARGAAVLARQPRRVRRRAGLRRPGPSRPHCPRADRRDAGRAQGKVRSSRAVPTRARAAAWTAASFSPPRSPPLAAPQALAQRLRSAPSGGCAAPRRWTRSPSSARCRARALPRSYAADADAFAPNLPEAVRADMPRLGPRRKAAVRPVLACAWHRASRRGGRRDARRTDRRIRRDAKRGSGQPIRRAAIGMRRIGPGSARLRRASAPYSWRCATQGSRRSGASASALWPTQRAATAARALAGYDVIRWQEKLTGRAFDPADRCRAPAWSKPHGVKVQGQTFLQSADYDTATTVAHRGARDAASAVRDGRRRRPARRWRCWRATR